MKASTFVLPAANKSTLQSSGTVKFTLYPDVTENRTLGNTAFTLIFQVSNTKFNILVTPFLEKYVESIKCSSQTLEIKHDYDTKFLKIYDSSTKSHPYYSVLLPVIGDHSLYFQHYEQRILTYSLTANEYKNKHANRTII